MQYRGTKYPAPDTGRYRYKNPFEAEYYFVEGMGFLPSDPREYEKRKIRRTSNLLGVSLVLYFVTASLAAPVLTKLILLLAGFRHPTETSYQLSQLVSYCISMFVPFFVYKLLVGIPGRAAFPTKKPAGRMVGYALPIGLAVTVVGSCLSNLISMELSSVGARPYYPESGPTLRPGPMLVYFLMTCVVAPLFEEFLFRGLVLQSLRPFGDTFALFTSAALFGLIHLSPVQQPNAFLMGLVIGYFTLVSGSLWTGVIVHAAVNVVSYLFSALELLLPAELLNLVGYGTYILFLLWGLIAVTVYVHKAQEFAFTLKHKCTYLGIGEKNGVFYTSPGMLVALVMICCFTLSFTL